jgi:imidazole glycerol phosphate synthase glutamine amidotransferase subunit
VTTVHVLDWGGGNLGSVARALRRLGVEPVLTGRPDDVQSAPQLVFPGVGSFGAVMAALDARGLREPLLLRLRADERPTLGICVGMQALFEASEESPDARGLGVLPGTVRRLRAPKVPQVGWNRVDFAGGAEAGSGYAYFVNSFAAPADGAWVAATTDYHGRFASAVRQGRLSAVQFHPEKSGRYGADLLRRWIEKPC